MPSTRVTALLAGLVLLVGCASATKRLEQGDEALVQGRYYDAAMRYVDALKKDDTLVEARDGLVEAGHAALDEGMDIARTHRDFGDPIAASEEFRALDHLLDEARGVRVALTVPGRYRDRRRAAFDEAITLLMDEAEAAFREGDFDESRDGARRVRNGFEASSAQLRSSFALESRALMEWAVASALDGRLRGAYGLAEEVLALGADAPPAALRDARDLQSDVLERGTRVFAVFPVTMGRDLEGTTELDPKQTLSDELELEHWREPPPFIGFVDPVRVRTESRRATRRGEEFRPGLIVRRLGTDYGVLIEVLRIERTESDVETEVRTTRTRDGRSARYTVESGRAQYEVRAEVLIVDDRGRRVEGFFTSETENGRFERGRYAGRLQDLDLSRREHRVLDPARQAAAAAELEEQLLVDLAAKLADDLFGRMLRKIP